MTQGRLLLAAALVFAAPGDARGPLDREPAMAAIRVFYGPREGFDLVDQDLISRARQRIDMTAYVLTDRRTISALEAAAARGVKIRIYLDPDQTGGRAAAAARFGQLLRSGGVEMRVKAPGGDMMHLKAYQVDGRWLRSGSANFSFSGERRQDNDIVVLDSRDAAGAFATQFERVWARPDNIPFGP
jgi:phosphatidylserine/phosphatidylglycerophosphate/cardiolipin synthase-like enzyme